MDKLQVGTQFELPEGHELIVNIQGYILSAFNNQVYLTGISTINLSEVPRTDLVHTTKLGHEYSKLGNMAETFELMDLISYHTVTISTKSNTHSYLFKNIQDSLGFLHFITAFKMQGVDATILYELIDRSN